MIEEVFADCAPIFIVGAPRSGTTLFHHMLNAHPAIAVADEVIFFDLILRARAVVPELDSKPRIDQLFTLLPAMDHVRYWRGTEALLAEVRERLVEDARPSYQKLYLFIMQAYASERGARRFGDKTPWNVRHLSTLVRWFPRCRIFHLVRDPRASVASRRRLPRTSKDVLTNAVKWQLDVRCATQFLASAAAGAPSMIEIRYEDLVQDPRPVLERACAFMDEDFDPRMLAAHGSRDVMFKDQPWKEGVFEPVFTASVAAWQRELKPAQVALIELLVGREMERYGYVRANISRLQRASMLAQLPLEVVAWARFKASEIARRRRERHIQFYYKSSDLYRVLVRTLFSRRR
jgi:Sulfotransferase family